MNTKDKDFYGISSIKDFYEIINKNTIDMRIGVKKIHSFHIDLCYQYLTILSETWELTCKSGFLRNIIYIILNEKKIKYHLNIVGYKKISSLCRWISKKDGGMYFYSPGMLIGFIKSNRVLKSDMIEYYQEHNHNYYSYDECLTHIKIIEELFDNEVSVIDKISHIKDLKRYNKWNVFESCGFYKPIKQIILLEKYKYIFMVLVSAIRSKKIDEISATFIIQYCYPFNINIKQINNILSYFYELKK